jgi:hypothetical protein
MKTNPLYWDCECETGYIHTKHVSKCPKCGAHADEAPDSVSDEVDLQVLNVLLTRYQVMRGETRIFRTVTESEARAVVDAAVESMQSPWELLTFAAEYDSVEYYTRRYEGGAWVTVQDTTAEAAYEKYNAQLIAECEARIASLPPVRCNGCGKETPRGGRKVRYHEWMRQDALGIPTGLYCEECYESSRYPYRRDDYTADAIACGENIDGAY